jgi:DNA-binding PadR family transcriptional regulator
MTAIPARKTTGRAMTSAVNWSLLGLVIERPSYGLEFYNRYQRKYGDVQPVSEASHIYSALDALVARGMIEKIEEVSGAEVGRQPKPRYQATPLGVRSYEAWLVDQIEVDRRRQELWVRQLAIFAHDPAAALSVLRRYRLQYLEMAAKTWGLPEGSVADSRSALIDELVAEMHRIGHGGMLSWLRFANARFEDRAGSVAHDDPPRT